MADIKISQLPAATTPLAGTEEVPLTQSGTTKKATVADIAAKANAVTAVTGTAPVVSSGGLTPAISMAAATGSVSGYLTSTDWNTFNNKQPAGSYLTSGGALGTPSSGTATNLTGLPLSTGVTGTLLIANGGTAATTAAGARTNILPSYPGNAGKVLAVNVGATDVEYISVGGTGTVTSVDVSGGTTGLTTSGGPVTSAGTITLAGTLAVANGGTGTATPALVAGTNVTITGTWPNQTVNSTAGGSGTVTSVAATVPSFLSVTGSPITTSGTLAITYSGTALPIANGGTGTTSTTFANLTTNVTGTLPVANGGTGATSLTANNVILGNGTSAVQVVAPGTTGNVLTSNGTTWTSSPAAATGVTSLSVASSNGFAGTSSGGSTPIITLSTSITGLLQGNGTAVSAVTIGSGLTFAAGTLSAASTTSIGLVRAVAINCILP